LCFSHLILKYIFYQVISCRTVALWFYILVFDHNATDPVMQKVAIYGADLSAQFKDVFLYLHAFFNHYLLLPNSRYILLPVFIFYPPPFVSTNQ
jgi:hypothetical protein